MAKMTIYLRATGGLFAIAEAINRQAAAVEGLTTSAEEVAGAADDVGVAVTQYIGQL